MTRAATALIAALFACGPAAAQIPSGWKVVKDNGKGKCQMAVPADWKQPEVGGKRLGGKADSPDGKTQAVLNMTDERWQDFRQTVFIVYREEKDRPKITESADLLWFEIVPKGRSRQTQWYVARPAGRDGTCYGQVNFAAGDKAAEETARKVVETMRGN